MTALYPEIKSCLLLSYVYRLSFFSLEQRWSNCNKTKQNQPNSTFVYLNKSLSSNKHADGPTADSPVQDKSVFPSTFLYRSPLLCYNPQHMQKIQMLFNQSVELLSSDLGFILLFMQYKVSVNTVLKGFYHFLKKVKNGIACFEKRQKTKMNSCAYMIQ